MDKYQGKYRISSARKYRWNYAQQGFYFITICTQGREHYFGKIEKMQMMLSLSGEIVQQCWKDIPLYFPFVILGRMVVMPNHVHGILILDGSGRLEAGDHMAGGITGKNNPMLKDSVAKVVRWFKGKSTFMIRQKLSQFSWQSRFHDHIIKDDNSFEIIDRYIEENPANWGLDKFYSVG